MNSILQRFSQLLWETDRADLSEAEALFSALVPGGEHTYYWQDIDYADQKRTNWSAAQHCQRLQTILVAFGETRLREDPTYAQTILGALKYWLIHDFENPNWWYNQIGIPQTLGNLAILLLPVLDGDTRRRAADLVKKGSMAANQAIASQWTGANIIWGMFNTLRHALLIEDRQLLAAAARRAAQEITFGEKTGIQEDYSFFQHGTRLYTGGYGRSFADSLCQMMFLLQGTEFQFPEPQRNHILSLVLDGLRPLTQQDTLDFACVGREISRIDALKVGTVERMLTLMLDTQELSRKEELQAYLDTIHGAPQPDSTKYFPKAATLCHHFNGIYVGARFLTDRTFGAETCDQEGQLCYNLSYGTSTCIMRTGREYHNIHPVWDHSRIPGTTSRIETDAQLLCYQDWWKTPLPNRHFGGLQEGSRAMIYQLTQHHGIEGYTADFAFEEGFVCLGARIQSQDPQESLVTTVDQCLQSTPVIRQQTALIHNGICYAPLDGTQLEVSVKQQIGSWQRNNAGLSPTPVSASVVTVSISHPAGRPSQYAYLICAADRPLPQVRVLRNDAQVQAISLPDGTCMALFHENCRLSHEDRVIRGTPGQMLIF